MLGGEANAVELKVAGRKAMNTFLKMADMLLTRLHFRHGIRHSVSHPSVILSERFSIYDMEMACSLFC
jgi:hypothetical protein